MTTDNVNVLAFYNSLDEKNINKWWVDRKYSLCTPTNYLIPFQIKKYANLNQITTFEIINSNDGTVVDLLSECTDKGLGVYNYADYDLMVYPSHIPLDTDYSGSWYIRISDGVTTLYSDDFCFCDVSNFVKIEYWHCSDFKYPKGHFMYNIPYKNRVYLKTDIGKPKYQYEDTVQKRKGQKFFIEQTSYKLNKFLAVVPEYLIDGFRLIRLHDEVEITYNGRVFEVDEFIMLDPKWNDKGDLAEVVCEFKTNTVVNINGNAYEDDCKVLCLVPEKSTKAIILENSNDYNNREYKNAQGDYVNFVVGDYFMIIKPTKVELNYFNGTILNPQPTVNGAVYYNESDDSYWIGGSAELIKPHITSISGGLVKGVTFDNVNFVEVIASVNNTEIVIATGTYNDLIGSGIPYNGVYSKLKIKSTNKNCYRFDESDWFLLVQGGIGVMEIENDNIVG